MTFASFFSLSISSSTEETMTPAFLLGGSVTSTISKSDLTSTFNSSGVNFFIGFDFAFIMLGRVAYLGWFSLRSVLQEEKSSKLTCQDSKKGGLEPKKKKNLLVKSSITPSLVIPPKGKGTLK